jgi:outer membrane receptor for ferrienterochelin and colicins
MTFKTKIIFFCFFASYSLSLGQTGKIIGQIYSNGVPVSEIKISVIGRNQGAFTNEKGEFTLNDIPYGETKLVYSQFGVYLDSSTVQISESKREYRFTKNIIFVHQNMDEVVVSGTLKAVGKLDSPVPVEIYNACFFQSNPSPSIFEAIQNVNGVRPQLNCNICNTGDIHINGLEGPYTMVLLDGMPIVSGLSTVYGLSGIPQALVDRIEIVKGPASTLYGSEAVGGLINIITKDPKKAPIVSIDHFATTWGELNTDLGMKYKANSKINGLIGINHFNYQIPTDKNKDGFTDLTLSHRISIFNKLSIQRKSNKTFNIAGRYVYEDRWGGQTSWTPQFRGGDSIYGESIYTSRWELMSTYQLPIEQNVFFQFSANGHTQNSYYGTTPFFANQTILFGQILWNKEYKRSDWLAGLSNRFTYYDDNTSATGSSDTASLNVPSRIYLPGLFLQNDYQLNENNRVLLGLRADYSAIHGAIFSPRINYKWMSQNKKNILRFGLGNGYRVANIFTEDHAALTGARTVVFKNKLKPERSYNANLNYVKQIRTKNNHYLTFDATGFYTYFENKILPDYESDPNFIYYDNLSGYAESAGISVNLDFQFTKKLTVNAGGTLMTVASVDNGIRNLQPLTERASGTWRIQYLFEKINLTIDYTGNLYGPMKLPLLGKLDDRAPFSPVFSIQNFQITKKFENNLQIYTGVKNLLNYRPPSNSIARAHDPFDKLVQYDNEGQIIPTPENPKALTFDPTYVYTSNQGIRFFLGIRYHLN